MSKFSLCFFMVLVNQEATMQPYLLLRQLSERSTMKPLHSAVHVGRGLLEPISDLEIARPPH
jgi:hypothetical protein